MTETIRLLSGDFVLLDLGSANSGTLFRDAPELASAATLVGVDARGDTSAGDRGFYRRISLKSAVAGSAGKRSFYSRRFPECSSFLQPKEELVKAYGMERYFELKEVIELECATVTNLLAGSGIKRVDFFKTDLEGLDYEVLASAPELVSQSLVVQSELRFQPIFEGEPPFHEIAAFLAKLGFELIHLRPEVWKYATPGRNSARDGRTVWCDAQFFLSPQRVRERFAGSLGQAFAKQIILARLLGLRNFAEYLFGQSSGELPGGVRAELREFTAPGPSISASIAKLPFGQLALEAARRGFAEAYTAASVFRDEVIGINKPR